MTHEQLASIKSIAFTLADGVSVIYPIAAPVVGVIEQVINLLDDEGLRSTEITPEQVRAIMAGMSAARASAVTEYIEHTRKHGG